MKYEVELTKTSFKLFKGYAYVEAKDKNQAIELAESQENIKWQDITDECGYASGEIKVENVRKMK